MKTREIKFLEKSILDLIQDNSNIEMEVILDYLDYFNKVRYAENDISPILDGLVSEKKIDFNEPFYSLNKKLLPE